VAIKVIVELHDPDAVEIADWESAEARDAHMQEAATGGLSAPPSSLTSRAMSSG